MQMLSGIIEHNFKNREIEKVQIEAARNVIGTAKLVSLNKLYTGTGWESLKDRRPKHRLFL